MSSYSSDRRSLLKIFGAIGATCAYPFASDELYGQTAAPLPESAPHFFNETDFAVISRVADLIIPKPIRLARCAPGFLNTSTRWSRAMRSSRQLWPMACTGLPGKTLWGSTNPRSTRFSSRCAKLRIRANYGREMCNFLRSSRASPPMGTIPHEPGS